MWYSDIAFIGIEFNVIKYIFHLNNFKKLWSVHLITKKYWIHSVQSGILFRLIK